MPFKCKNVFSILILLMITPWLRSIEIQQTHWGFDGKVLLEHFNSLSLLVYNPENKPFEGVIVLAEGSILPNGAQTHTPCYIAPGSSRWVHFQPWIGKNPDDFKVSCLPSNESFIIKAPQIGSPATVYLNTNNIQSLSIHNIKTYPSEIFPTSTLTVNSLACLIIDQVPRWQPQQKQAFRDWVWRGGTVFVLSALDGKYPQFPQELDFLNNPSPMSNQLTSNRYFGSGYIVHYYGERSSFGLDIMNKNGFYPPESHLENNYFSSFSDNLFEMFNKLVKPEHPWAVIYIILILYLLLIGPGAWLAARRKMDYRVLNISIVTIITCCVLIMWTVGRRGYGEQARITTLGYAESLGNDNFIATQWSSCFVTSSDQYTINHPGKNNIFACPSETETVEAIILNDNNDNQLNANIPLYSSRSFIHGGYIQIAGLQPKIDSLSVNNGKLENLAITLFDKNTNGNNTIKIEAEALAFYQGNFYRMPINDNKINNIHSTESFSTFIKKLNESSEVMHYDRYGNKSNFTLHDLHNHYNHMIAYGLGGKGVMRQWSEENQNDNQIALFILINHAPSFEISSDIAKQGRLVIRFNLTVPEKKTP